MSTHLRDRLFTVVVAIGGLVLVQGETSAQTVNCSPKDFRQSLVRIDRGPRLAPGTGVVIVKRDQFAVVLTARHVIASPADFSVYFQMAPSRPFPVSFNDDAILALPETTDVDLALFRVDGPIPEGVRSEDPYTREAIPDAAAMVSWGYPAQRGGTLCSYGGRLQGTSGGRLLVAEGYVEEGVSGGPMFFLDPTDNTYKLAAIVVAGDGNAQQGTTRAIDVRQAVALVSNARDRRNGNRAHVWPNIPLPDEFVVGAFHSFQKIAAGKSVMGSNRASDERWPGAGGSGQTTLTLPVFYMGKYEVTVAQYQECVAAKRCSAPKLAPNLSLQNLPVVAVTWTQADEYARWLKPHLESRPDTPLELKRLLNAGWEFDLPSEEEWEKSARKGGTDAYPWGNGPNPANANYNTGKLRVVDSSRCERCEYGLFDMAGNAREWTRSLKLPYPYDATMAEDRTAPGNRAIRGGSYERMDNPTLAAQIIRSANRQEAAPSHFDEYTGFRVALICKKERNCGWREPD